MCKFYSIDSFRKQIATLTKKPKDGYTSVEADIRKQFSGKTFQEIWDMRDMISDDIPLRLIKTRIPNSSLRVSKKDGFRLLFLINSEKKDVTFLYVYPKSGKHGMESVNDNFLEELVKEYIDDTDPEEFDIDI